MNITTDLVRIVQKRTRFLGFWMRPRSVIVERLSADACFVFLVDERGAARPERW